MMCVCSKCGCKKMKRNGRPELVDWGYAWGDDEWFDIEIPYKCPNCGFEDVEEITTSEN